MKREIIGGSIVFILFLTGSIIASCLNEQEKVVELYPQKEKMMDTLPIDPIIETEEEYIGLTSQSLLVTGTIYNAVPGQTDDTPFITADGSVIDTAALRRGEIRWCALSQDLLWFNGGRYRYGDTVLCMYNEEESVNGFWVVHDAMNKRFKNMIDFLVPYGSKEIPGKVHGILLSKFKL